MKLWVKLVVIFVIIVMLQIPLFLMSDISDERSSYKNDVTSEIAASFGGKQTIFTPYLHIYFETQAVSNEGKNTRYGSLKLNNAYFAPIELNVDGILDISKKSRRIYSGIVYGGKFDISGKFMLTESQLMSIRNKKDVRVTNVYATIDFAVSDSKGLRGTIDGIYDGRALDFDRLLVRELDYSKLSRDAALLMAPIDIAKLQEGKEVNFTIKFPLSGTSKVSFVPTGLTSTFNISGNWPHPSFYGEYLPDKRDITDAGFTSSWVTTWMSGQRLDKKGIIEMSIEKKRVTPSFIDEVNNFGVNFIETVDIYSFVDRSIKYGFLIITLTFLVIFMLEKLSNALIHPVQYGLIGSALVVFYLMLLSLSEHVSFAASYFIAAVACILLISFYLYFSLKNIPRTGIFTTFLSVLYIILYLLLNVSDYALLLGSLLIFGTLVAIMVSTRNIDWYTSDKAEK